MIRPLRNTVTGDVYKLKLVTPYGWQRTYFSPNNDIIVIISCTSPNVISGYSTQTGEPLFLLQSTATEIIDLTQNTISLYDSFGNGRVGKTYYDFDKLKDLQKLFTDVGSLLLLRAIQEARETGQKVFLTPTQQTLFNSFPDTVKAALQSFIR